MDDQVDELFEQYVKRIREADESPDVEVIVRKLRSKFERLDPVYKGSSFLSRLFRRQLEDPAFHAQPYPRIKELSDELKANMRLRREIFRLEEQEVNMGDEEDDKNSAYIKLSKYEDRMSKVYKKYCQLKNKDDTAGRIILQNVKFSGTKIKDIDRAMEKFYNTTRQFPDFIDILSLVQTVNERQNLGMRSEEEQSLARKAFEEFGRMLKERREYDSYDLISSYLPDDATDPAATDPALDQVLTRNQEECTRKIDQIIETFAERQRYHGTNDEEGEEDGEEEDDVESEKSDESGDNSIAESEDEEKDEDAGSEASTKVNGPIGSDVGMDEEYEHEFDVNDNVNPSLRLFDITLSHQWKQINDYTFMEIKNPNLEYSKDPETNETIDLLDADCSNDNYDDDTKKKTTNRCNMMQSTSASLHGSGGAPSASCGWILPGPAVHIYHEPEKNTLNDGKKVDEKSKNTGECVISRIIKQSKSSNSDEEREIKKQKKESKDIEVHTVKNNMVINVEENINDDDVIIVENDEEENKTNGKVKISNSKNNTSASSAKLLIRNINCDDVLKNEQKQKQLKSKSASRTTQRIINYSTTNAHSTNQPRANAFRHPHSTTNQQAHCNRLPAFQKSNAMNERSSKPAGFYPPSSIFSHLKCNSNISNSSSSVQMLEQTYTNGRQTIMKRQVTTTTTVIQSRNVKMFKPSSSNHSCHPSRQNISNSRNTFPPTSSTAGTSQPSSIRQSNKNKIPDVIILD